MASRLLTRLRELIQWLYETLRALDKTLLGVVLLVLANLATLGAFFVTIWDRRDAADINAWHLLADYRCQQYDAGQILALQTLVNHGQSLYNFGGPEGKWLVGAKLNGARLHHSNLIGMNFTYAELKDALLRECKCKSTTFYSAELSGAEVYGGDFTGAMFDHADISGMTEVRDTEHGEKIKSTKLYRNVLTRACWSEKNPPKLPSVILPAPLPFEDCRRAGPPPPPVIQDCQLVQTGRRGLAGF
jgi:hypothetical protein